MPRQAFIAAAIITALLLYAALGFLLWHRGLELKQANAQLEAAIADLNTARTTTETNLAQARVLQEQLDNAHARIADLERQTEEATRSQKLLETEMRRAIESKDVTISELQGKLTVNIVDRILFDSGEATLKPEGEEMLRKIAAVLARFPNRQVHVIGHTDNVPIRASARHRYPSNWELSTARATAAVRFLTEQGGVDPRRIGAVGYGEFRPIADNSTPEGRAQNRRIAIVVLSEELVGLDAAPTAKPFTAPTPDAATVSPTETNAPPANTETAKPE